MTVFSEQLHRTAKAALDSGEAESIHEAMALFQSYRLCIQIGESVRNSATQQAAVLTAVNTARRCFLGGVVVVGPPDIPLLVPWEASRTLGEAALSLEAEL